MMNLYRNMRILFKCFPPQLHCQLLGSLSLSFDFLSFYFCPSTTSSFSQCLYSSRLIISILISSWSSSSWKERMFAYLSSFFLSFLNAVFRSWDFQSRIPASSFLSPSSPFHLHYLARHTEATQVVMEHQLFTQGGWRQRRIPLFPRSDSLESVFLWIPPHLHAITAGHHHITWAFSHSCHLVVSSEGIMEHDLPFITALWPSEWSFVSSAPSNDPPDRESVLH